jgi:predicted DNA-binding protein with PD1-like motif
MCVSDEEGKMVGGHLMDGNRIYTTAEVVLGCLDDLYSFSRVYDARTGFPELVITARFSNSGDDNVLKSQ